MGKDRCYKILLCDYSNGCLWTLGKEYYYYNQLVCWKSFCGFFKANAVYCVTLSNFFETPWCSIKYLHSDKLMMEKIFLWIAGESHNLFKTIYCSSAQNGSEFDHNFSYFLVLRILSLKSFNFSFVFSGSVVQPLLIFSHQTKWRKVDCMFALLL